MPDWVAFSRAAARVKEPSSQTAMIAWICQKCDFQPLEILMPKARLY